MNRRSEYDKLLDELSAHDQVRRAPEILGKALSDHRAGRITALDVTRIEARLNAIRAAIQ